MVVNCRSPEKNSRGLIGVFGRDIGGSVWICVELCGTV